MSYAIEDIFLKRYDRKLWAFNDTEPTDIATPISAPKRVELAVLDYLSSQGWEGYFTEYFDYDRTLLYMMCCCNCDNYLNDKRQSLKFTSAEDAFDHALDGRWGLSKFTHARLIENATNFSEDMIKKILSVWQVRNVKSIVVGNAYFDVRSANELNHESLQSFYKARGGLQFYLEHLEYFHSAELQSFKYRYRELDKKIRNTHEYGSPIRKLMLEFLSHIRINPYFQTLCEYKVVGEWIDKIKELNGVAFGDEILELATDLHRCLEKKQLESSKWKRHALLDLVIWKQDEGIVSVEVKAPNDRLMSHQKDQLKHDARNGIKSWVIYAHENNVDEKSFRKKRETAMRNSIKRKNSDELITFSENLKQHGLWNDIMKDLVFKIASGKPVTNMDAALYFLNDHPDILFVLKGLMNWRS